MFIANHAKYLQFDWLKIVRISGIFNYYSANIEEKNGIDSKRGKQQKQIWKILNYIKWCNLSSKAIR